MTDKQLSRYFGKILAEKVQRLDEAADFNHFLVKSAGATKKFGSEQDAHDHAKQLGQKQIASVHGIKRDKKSATGTVSMLRRTYAPHAMKEAEAPKPTHRVLAAFGGKELSTHHSQSGAEKAAMKHSIKQPVHVWTTSGGDFGMGKAISHFNNGVKTSYKKK